MVVTRGMDLRAMTRQALAAFGGASSIVRPGESVFIKPNFVFAGTTRGDIIQTGESTKPEIVMTVAEECLKAGASLVLIGDGAQVASFAWSSLPMLDGSTDMQAEARRLQQQYGPRVVLACLNSDSPDWDQVPGRASGLGAIRVASLVSRADRVISLPVAKTHRVTAVTLGMKNLVGVTPLAPYAYLSDRTGLRIKLHDSPGGITGCIVDLHAALRPSLTIIDCSVGCEGNGPRVDPGKWGSTVDMRERVGAWLLVASTDGLAADATTCRLIGQEPREVEHLALAWARGLGQLREDLITVEGPAWDEIRMQWTAAELVHNVGELLKAL